MNIYGLTADLLALKEMLEDENADAMCIFDTMEAVQGEYEHKLEGYCCVIKEMTAEIDFLKAEAKRLADKASVITNNITRMKKVMFDSMKATDNTKIKTPLFTVSIQKNGGKTPIITAEDADLNLLPDYMVRVKYEADMEAIREALEEGCTVPGYTLGERGESLRIK